MNNLDDTERTKLMELAMKMMQLFEDQTDSG
jgi:hypothetical protein